MINLGDITKIDGTAHPIPSVVIGGSPCQDLSVAGKRAGLAGERSGLFMEQIRVIKEMRSCGRTDKHGYKLPRYMVWENVPGAFSSAGGEDFRAVLEETCRVADETVTIPRPAKGKWGGGAGLILGDNYSVAWRVHDAQYWGVPQRRRRIALVADFGGQSAGEILFERESVPGDTDAGGAEREGAAGDAAEGFGETISFHERAGKPGGGKGILIQDEKTGSLRAGVIPATVTEQPTAGPLMANGYPDKLTHQDVKEGMYPVANNVVRRLTPTEYERLQGYPDGWTDIGEWTDGKGKKHKDADSPRYKALGNSIALPFWDWLLKRIAAECDEKTMVSLFDGIGGFPLCWQRAGGETLWVSEIEEFCIAVTKKRFGEAQDGNESGV